MKMYITFTKRTLALILLSLLFVLFVLSEFNYTYPPVENAKTNQNRVDFAAGLGYTVDESCIDIREIKIPQFFDGFYKEYSASQQAAGFNLSAFAGCDAKLYSYKILSGKDRDGRVLNLIVYKNRVIGADIS